VYIDLNFLLGSQDVASVLYTITPYSIHVKKRLYGKMRLNVFFLFSRFFINKKRWPTATSSYNNMQLKETGFFDV